MKNEVNLLYSILFSFLNFFYLFFFLLRGDEIINCSDIFISNGVDKAISFILQKDI